MSYPSVLVLGFDSLDPTRGQQMMDQGLLPNLAALAADGHTSRLVNPYGLVSGPVWPTLMSGTGVTEHQVWTWRRLRNGTYRQRHIPISTPSAKPPVWELLRDQGIESLVIDVPRHELSAEHRGTQVTGFRQHDAFLDNDFRTSPPELRDRLADQFGVQVDDCDRARTDDRFDELYGRLMGSIDDKLAAAHLLLEESEAPLAIITFTESHCGGHQLLGHRSPLVAADGSSDPVVNIYTKLDAAAGSILERHCGPETAVVVIFSHGLSDVNPVSRLLPPVLEAINHTIGAPKRTHKARAFVERLPNRLHRLALRLTGRDFEPLDHWVDSSQRFFSVALLPIYGGIRLNLEGREPRGLVGVAEKETVLAKLEKDLRSLRDVDTGVPLVTAVERAVDHYASEPDIGLPDLIIEWAHLEHQVRGSTSDTLGTIMADIENLRPGNHLPDGHIIFTGPRINAQEGSPVDSDRLVPTIAKLLGTSFPGITGESMVDLTEPVSVQ